jgi:hypothetical protein
MNTLRPQTVQALFYNHKPFNNNNYLFTYYIYVDPSPEYQYRNSAPLRTQIKQFTPHERTNTKKKKTMLWSTKDHRDGVNRHAHHARSCQDQISKDEPAIVLQNRILFESPVCQTLSVPTVLPGR